MKTIKKAVIFGTMALTIGVTSLTALADSNYGSPAEAVAGLTGKTVEEVMAEKTETGSTYGTIAAESGKLTEFKSEMLEIKNNALAEKVSAAILTQEEADQIIAALEERQVNCDGLGSDKIGQKMGAGFGNKNRTNGGNGQGEGGRGAGRVQRNGGGACQR